MGIKVGTFTQKLSAGTQAISGLGFQPDMILFFSSGQTASGSYAAHHNAMYGMATSADAGSVSCSSEDAKTTGIHNSTGRAAQKAITFCEFGDVVKAEADLDSIDSDGFTLDWTTADAVARIINYIAVSGFDSLKIVEWTMNTTSGNQSVTGVGFIPDVVINISEQNNAVSATPYVTASGGIGLGVFDDTTEWGLSTFDLESSDVISRSGQSNVDLFAGVNVAGTARYASFVSMDADGFTVNVASASTPANKIYSLCLKGGPQVSLGTITKAGSQAGSVEHSIGFRPGGLILASANPGSIKSNDTDCKTSVGLIDRDDQHSMEFFVDQAATSDVGMVNILDRGLLINDNHDSTIETQAHADHFNADGFHINWGKDGQVQAFVNYLAFEEEISNRTGEALKVFTGVFDKPTSTGSQAITGVGFTPKILLCWYGGATSDDTWENFCRAGFGAATSPTNRYACGDAAEEDLTTSNTQTTRSALHCISIADPDGTIEGEADLTSFDADGFTLDWDTANSKAYKIHYLALGGDDEIEAAKILSFVTSTSTGQQSVTGAGFRPDAVIAFYNTRISATEDTQHAQGGFGMGLYDGIKHNGWQRFLLDASATESHARGFDNDGFLEGTTNIPSEDQASIGLSFDDDGFTFQLINSSPSPGYRTFALCIKGIHISTGDWQKPLSSTGNQGVTGARFQPVAIMSMGVNSLSADGVATHGIVSIGCSDGINENAIHSAAYKLATANTQAISTVGQTLIQDDVNGSPGLATTAKANLDSFDADGFTINWTVNDAHESFNYYLAFERNWVQSGPLTQVAATAFNTLALSQSAVPATDFARSVANVLSLLQAVRPSIIFKSGSNVLALSQLVQATISFGDVFTPSVTSTLALSQAVQPNSGISVSATNILALGHIATNDSILAHSAANTLALSQAVSQNLLVASAANTLALTDVAGVGRNLLESASSIMVLAQVLANNFKLASASNAMLLTQSASAAVDTNILIAASNSFLLTQTVTQTIDHFLSIPSDPIDDQSKITLTQSVLVGRNHRISASNSLNLVDEVRLKEHNEAVQSFLSFAQQVGRQIPISASNALFLQQEAARIFKLASQLNLISSVASSKGRDAASVIPFVQTATILSDFARLISQDLNIRQSVGLVHEFAVPNVECTYSPFVGTVTSGITPPPTTAPTLGTATLTLTWPFVAPTTTLVLRNPELNNSERLQFARINRTTRGGDLKIFSDPTWPKQESLKVQIEALTSAQKDSLVSFFEDNIGLEIGLLDDENRQWKGIITQPDADITDVRGDGCSYSVIFEFEGELQ